MDLVASFPKPSGYQEIAKYLSVELPELKSLYEDQGQDSQALPYVDTFKTLHMFTSTRAVHGFVGAGLKVENKASSTSARPDIKLVHSDDPRRLDRYHLLDLLFGLRPYFAPSENEITKAAHRDLLSNGILKMFEGQTIPVWLVLACRIHVDIQNTVLDKSRCWKELFSIRLSACTSL